MSSRIVIVFIGLMVAWGGLWLRGAYLQIFPSPKLSRLERRQFETRIEVNGRRGQIVDRNGRELAATVKSWSLYADPMILERPNAAAAKLARILNYPRRTLLKMLKQKRRFVWIYRHLSDKQAEQIRQLDWRGLGLLEEPKRVYPNRRLLSQVLGFVGSEGHGLEGLEKTYDQQLVGEKKDVILPRDARGRPLLPGGGLLTKVKDGARLELTIDAELQFYLEQELMRVIQEKRADGAVGLVMDPHTGEILAMANEPGYDLEEALVTPSEMRRIRAITDAFEPGSTLKTLLVASAIKDGVVRPSTRINCEGGRFRLGGRWIREADTEHSYGELSVAEILAYSSNVGTAKIGLMMGDERLRLSLMEFGIGEKLGIDLPGESRGILQPLPWRPHLLGNVSFGHGTAVTPLQLASAYSAIANGGVLKKPKLVRRVIPSDVSDEDAPSFQAEDIRRVLSEEQSSTMRLMLRAATMEHATGERARIPGFPVAGKTGTAQKVDLTHGGYQKGAYISSFAGFVPAHSPKFVIYIAVDNPREHYYASKVAAPVFARIAQFAVHKAGLSPILLSEKHLLDKATRTETRAQIQSQALSELRQMAEAQDSQVVPQLEGLSLREALRRLRGLNLDVDIRGQGLVSQTVPEAGAPWSKRGRLRLQLTESPKGETR